MCRGYKKIVLLAARNRHQYAVRADRSKTVEASFKKGRWHIYCGDVQIKYARGCYSNKCNFNKEIDNRFENFMAVAIAGNKLTDKTADFWLELTKDF